MISLNSQALRRNAAAAFLRAYAAGDPVHLVGDHPWSGRRGVVQGDGFIWNCGGKGRWMYYVRLDPEHAKYPGHVCFAEEKHLLPVREGD